MKVESCTKKRRYRLNIVLFYFLMENQKGQINNIRFVLKMLHIQYKLTVVYK